jgi:SAM-dependent MidA family methyltransferase
MDLALYCPVYGYYEKEKDNLGRRGDFFTSVSVGNVFGELLAVRFSEWLMAIRNNHRPLEIVEAGAHDGRLARDILTWLHEKRTALFHEIRYSILEPSATRQRWQQETLAPFGNQVRWIADIEQLNESGDAGGVHGILFSNELLDALPVRRFGWDAGRKMWFEWGVSVDGDRFVWRKMEIAKTDLPAAPGAAELLNALPDGFTIEVCRAATEWWRKAAAILAEGRLVTLDYGLRAEEFFSPDRHGGTLRAYRHHRQVNDVLADPGEQDITAQVNFTALQVAGESAGLNTDAFVSQEEFLLGIAKEISGAQNSFGDWTPARARQLQTLTHPEHLGRRFRVLVQSRS